MLPAATGWMRWKTSAFLLTFLLTGIENQLVFSNNYQLGNLLKRKVESDGKELVEQKNARNGWASCYMTSTMRRHQGHIIRANR
jgi:hypothetical protein